MPEFKVQQAFLALARNYKLYTHPDGGQFGEIRSRVFRIRPAYWCRDNTGRLIFKIQGNLFKTHYKVIDENGQYICHFKTPFIAWLTKRLRLFVGNQEYSNRGNFWALNFEIIDPSGKQVINVSKKFFQIRDSFLVGYPDGFDLRVAVAAAIVADDRYHPSH